MICNISDVPQVTEILIFGESKILIALNYTLLFEPSVITFINIMTTLLALNQHFNQGF